MLSWGYLLQRAAQLGLDLCSQIARVPGAKEANRFSAEHDEWGADHMSEIHVAGRIVLNLWRILRHEVLASSSTCLLLMPLVYLVPVISSLDTRVREEVKQWGPQR